MPEALVKTPYRYNGYEFDEETGNYFLKARYYNPSIGRFISEDSYRGKIEFTLSLNLYTYCSNEPIMYWDPSGHVSLRVGSKGKDVEEIQRKLNIEVTGVFDKSTLNAVNAFKKNHKLGNTGQWHGVVGNQTYASIISNRTVTQQEMVDKGFEAGTDDSVYYDGGGITSQDVINSIVKVSSDLHKEINNISHNSKETNKLESIISEVSNTLENSNPTKVENTSVVKKGVDKSLTYKGVGLQLEMQVSGVSVGAEVIWYSDNNMINFDEKGNEYSYGFENPYFYLYSGVGVGKPNQELANVVVNKFLSISKNPLQYLKPGDLIENGVSISGVVVVGNNEFNTPNDYEGQFNSVGGSVAHYKVGYAQGYNNSGEIMSRAVSLGWTSGLGVSYSAGYTSYTLMNGEKLRSILEKHGDVHMSNLRNMCTQIENYSKYQRNYRYEEVNYE